MKKNEFFAQLRTAFTGMDEELVKDILSDYENHFKEGMENGKSEEEICEELGNVEEIRQAFLEENPAAVAVKTNPSTSTNSTVKQANDFITDFPIRPIADNDTNGADIYNRSYPGIQRINVQLINADIEIKKSSTNHVELFVSGDLAEDREALKEMLHVSASAGTLTILQEKKAGENASQVISWMFGFKAGAMSGKVYSTGLIVQIAVPEQFEAIQAKSVSGDIVAKNSSAKTLLLHAGSGDVQVENCQADELLATSSSGDVSVEACRAEKIDAVSVSGDVKATFDQSAQCRAKSTSGDCKVTIGNQVDAVVSSTSGDLSIHYIGKIGLEMALSTTSGDLFVDCGGVRCKDRRKVQGHFGELDSKVKASTVAGDIKLKD